MSAPTEKSLSRKQLVALSALVSQPNLQLASAMAGVSERTLYRWLHDDSSFKVEYLRLRQEIVNNAVFQLQKACNNAVNVAISLMNDPETPASVRLAAARLTLEMSLQYLQTEALEERIQQLEGRLEEFSEHRNKTGKNGTRHTISTR